MFLLCCDLLFFLFLNVLYYRCLCLSLFFLHLLMQHIAAFLRHGYKLIKKSVAVCNFLFKNELFIVSSTLVNV